MKKDFYKKFQILHFDNLDSTNLEAVKMAESSLIDEFSILLADQQNQGRGRLNRKWDSQKGNLFFSILLHPKQDLAKINQISFIAAVALVEALSKILDGEIKLQNKWPNDVLLDGKKLAGILLESAIDKGLCKYVVLGIGVNLKSKPQDVMFPACDLQAFGVDLSPREMLEKFLDEFEILYQKWCDFGFDAIKNLWMQRAFKLDCELVVDGKKGVFKGIDGDGNLLLENSGAIEKILVGDVS